MKTIEEFTCPYCGSREFKIVKVLFQSNDTRLYACTCSYCGKVFLLHSDRLHAVATKL